MRLTTSQLQTQHKSLVDALKRGEQVEIPYHGHILGVVYPKANSTDHDSQIVAMDAFFGMHEAQPTDTVEAELREIRQGRRNRRL